MKALDVVSVILLIVGGLNWGLVGLFDFNLVSFLFGSFPVVARIIYVIVGLAAVYLLIQWKAIKQCCSK